MSARKTVKWLLLIVGALAAAGGGFAYWKWTTLNRELLETVRSQLAEAAPGWSIEVEAARFDWHRRIHLYNVSLKLPDGSPLVRIPEAILIVDRDKLADSQIVDVQRVRLLRPDVHLLRDPQGKWNWQKLPPLKKPRERTQALPEIEMEDATVQVRLQQSGGRTDAVVDLKDCALKFVPNSEREYLIRGSTTVRDAGKLTLTEGALNLATGAWSLDGRMQNVEAGGELLGLAVGTSPELRANVARLEKRLRELTPKDERPKTPVNADALPVFGASATLDVAFHLARRPADSDLQFNLHAKVRDGRLRNPVLPVELDELEGSVHWTNDIVEIRDVSAKSGILRLQGDANIRRVGEATPIRVRFKVTNLPLNDKLENRLPLLWQPYYRKISPRGRIDLSGILEYDGRKEWSHSGCVLTTRDCSFAHADFPYRFTSVNGIATQDGDRVTLNFKGRAGRKPATLTGWVRNPGPEAASHYDLRITDFQLDDALLAVCKPNVRRTLKSLGGSGQADVYFRSTDVGGLRSAPRLFLRAALKDCIAQHTHFPYRLSRFNGIVTFDSATDVWTFSNLSAVNGTGRFTGSGYLSNEKGGSHVELKVTGHKANLDLPLYRALSRSLRDLWDEFSPTGTVDLDIGLKWTQGAPLQVTIPRCTVTNGTMTVKSFPFEFQNITASFRYNQPQLDIISFRANHNDTQIRAEGKARIESDGEWELRLPKFLADDLIPNRVFRKALEPKLRAVVEELDPRGPVSLSGMLHFRGTKDKKDPVTAAWNLKLVLTGNALNFGVKLKDVHGRVIIRGTWDGRRVDMKTHGINRFDLDSINVHGYQFTKVKGPFTLYDKRLVVGTAKAFAPLKRGQKPPKIEIDEQISAKAIGGNFSLNARALFGKETDYQLVVGMNQASLERFARRYLHGARKLKGKMYGRVELWGKGKSSRDIVGRGRLLINQAALFELPVIVQVLSVTNLKPADNAAFKFAYADFAIRDRKFLFNAIDLAGDSITLRGKGTARFDGRLEIDFYSMLPRSAMPVAILQQLVRSATRGWVGVKVRGSVAKPVAEIRAIPQVDDALQQFLNALGGLPSGSPPWFQFPQSNRETLPRR